MINPIYKKIVALILIISFILPYALIPQRAKATALVFDYANLGTNLLSLIEEAIDAVASVATEISAYLNWLKEYTLDPLAFLVAKQIVRQVSASIINWINNGFDGSPSFVQNPGAFFLDLADQMTGEFLAKNGGPLSELCSPFSIELKLALAFKYHSKGQKRYACTLGTIIKNTKSAVKNASINGFTAGDFRQGGWPAFTSMTMEPQNNIYTAYMQTDGELTIRVGNLQIQKKEQLSQGSGFLSFPDPSCRKLRKAEAARAQDIYDNGAEGEVDPNLITFNEKKETWSADTSSCPVTTPGRVIAQSLQKQLDSPTDVLNLADEFAEIIDALITQLVTQILQAGLSAVSDKNSSGTSYIDETIKDLNENTPEVEQLKKDLLGRMPEFIDTTLKYKTNRDASLKFMTDINDNYKLAKVCYENKIAIVPQYLTSYEINIAQSRISDIEIILSEKLSTTTAHFLSLAQNAQFRLDKLAKMQTDITGTKTMIQLNAVSTEYMRLIRSSVLTTAIDVKNSAADLTKVKTDFENYNRDAINKVNECQGFPENIRGN